MKRFEQHQFSPVACRRELARFEKLLADNYELGEREHILPFFRENRNLAAFVGSFVADIAYPDLLATEYDLFGDFVCDLVIGDSASRSFLLVEFEDARPRSLFLPGGARSTPEWSPRLEHGFSQVVDWFWKLDDMQGTVDFEQRFGTRAAAIHGLLVVGRDQTLESREQARLRWRQDHTIVNSKRISIITYDQLASGLGYRLRRYPTAP